MTTKKIRLLSAAAMAAGLVLTGVTAAAVANTGHTPTRTTLAADIASSAVNLDNCPILAEGYHGGCVNQLQTELNADDGDNLTVDGTFGPATKTAVEIFQQEHNIVSADGIVGPQTKAALDNPGSNSVATPQPGPAEPASPNCSQDATQGPPSASIPPGQQSYFQCQPPGKPGKKVNGTDCLLSLGGGVLSAAAGPVGGLADLLALGGLGLGGVEAARTC
jgi:peptidoglycan hydrolase-like protein with peptidoglycan-binding domain